MLLGRPRKTILLLLALLLFGSFVYFSYLVAKERFTQFDFDTTVKLQDHLSRQFDLPFSMITLLGSAEITSLVLIVITLIQLFKRRWLTVLAMGSFGLTAFFELFGKLSVFHPAPPFFMYRGVLQFNFPSQFVHTDYSYPSGHMARTSYLVAFVIVWLMLRASAGKRFLPKLILASFLVVMGISRVYLGEHWASDVIGGTLLGSSLGILTALTIPAKSKS